jgi:hypothetical protein
MCKEAKKVLAKSCSLAALKNSIIGALHSRMGTFLSLERIFTSFAVQPSAPSQGSRSVPLSF